MLLMRLGLGFLVRLFGFERGRLYFAWPWRRGFYGGGASLASGAAAVACLATLALLLARRLAGAWRPARVGISARPRFPRSSRWNRRSCQARRRSDTRRARARDRTLIAWRPTRIDHDGLKQWARQMREILDADRLPPTRQCVNHRISGWRRGDRDRHVLDFRKELLVGLGAMVAYRLAHVRRGPPGPKLGRLSSVPIGEPVWNARSSSEAALAVRAFAEGAPRTTAMSFCPP